MKEKELLTRSGLYTAGILFLFFVFWFLFSIQFSFGYSGTGTTQDLKSGSRFNGDLLAQPFNGSVTIFFGTQSTSPIGTGTAGYIGTNTTGLPKIKYSYTGGSSTITLDGFDHVAINGSDIPLSGSVSNKLDAVGGVGTGNTFNNPTLAGIGTSTATIRANGLDITPAEYAAVDNATGELQAQITETKGSVTNHVHSGSDGTTQVSHTNLTNKGTQTHTQIDDFIASKAQASGVASLDANSLVVQNPASASKTPGTSTIVMTGSNTDRIADAYLSDNITKLGTPTTDNISEGSTNKYYTDARVNSVIGSSSVGSRLNEQIISVADGHHFVYDVVLGKWKNATTTASVGFGGITGTPTDNLFFKDTVPTIGKILVGISDTILIPATTTTTLSGTTTTGRFFNAQSTTEVTGSTTAFDDSSSTNHTITPVGNAVMSTAQKKFGISAGLFDGVGDYAAIPAHANWNFGTNNFTIEIQRKSTDTVNMAPFDWGTAGSDNFFYENSPGGGMSLYLKSTGTDSAVIAGNSRFGTITTTTWTHVAISRQGNTVRGFTSGIQGGTWSVTGKSFDFSGNNLSVGIYRDLVTYAFNGYVDEVRVSNNARYTEDFSEPTSAFVNDANTLLLINFDRSDTSYFTNRLAYVPPGTTNAFLNIISDGTNSTKVEMVLGSETPFSSTTVHILQAPPGSRGLLGFYDTYCSVEFKDIIGSGTSVQDEAYSIAKRVNIVKSHPVDPKKKVTQAEAINSAQEDYMNLFRQSDVETYKANHIAEYTTVIADSAGSVSVNLTKLNSDAQAYHENQRKVEFEVLPDRIERIRKKKKTMESDKGITNISVIADDPSTDELLKGADNRTASIGNQIGVLFGAFQKQTEEIGSLTAALENQKIAYNEEVDNLYKWINAIIIALIALGAGSGGWATLRNKRKGT